MVIRISPYRTRVIRGEKLRVGMQTVKEALTGPGYVVDEKLVRFVPTSCLGLHFETERGAVICYEPVAFQRIAIE